MGAIIKAIHVIDDSNKGKRRIFLSEKIKLLKLLEENEVIIDFLIQKDKKENQIDNNEEKDIVEIEDVETEDEEDILIPDEHPENIISLYDIVETIRDIEKLLENRKLTEEQKEKLKKFIFTTKKYFN